MIFFFQVFAVGMWMLAAAGLLAVGTGLVCTGFYDDDSGKILRGLGLLTASVALFAGLTAVMA